MVKIPALTAAALALFIAAAAADVPPGPPPRKPPPPPLPPPVHVIPEPRVAVPSQLTPPPATLGPVERGLAETTRLRLQQSIDALQRQSDMAPLDPMVQDRLRESRGDLERMNRALGQ